MVDPVNPTNHLRLQKGLGMTLDQMSRFFQWDP